MENKKKKFSKPKAEIIDFNSDDVIRTSGGLMAGIGDSEWDGDDNGENFGA